MHEHSLMEEVLETLLDHLRDHQVRSADEVRAISLTVSVVDIHSPESFRQAFALLSRGTLLEKAALDLQVLPARLECASCGFRGSAGDEGADVYDPTPCAPCPSCGEIAVLRGGRGVQDLQIILAE